eukprot:TRINITY_DN107758_c0_g1_i1.p1 TRINITY_DN107758_c0_g1~~TRINITY_DN107758_c0_g1_i1.p1  ORF type:complete len:292 (+),score=69.02 TRINITY_DN107758_c0_g1_i1:52-876(+)
MAGALPGRRSPRRFAACGAALALWLCVSLELQSRLFIGGPAARVTQRPATEEVSLRSTEIVFDPNSLIDRTELQLINTTFRLTSSVYGFPDFEHLLALNGDGTVRFYGGMVSKEPGAWSVIEGDKTEGEDPNDLYIEWTQPLTEKYQEAFDISSKTCFWRGKLNFKPTKSGNRRPYVEGGIVVSEAQEGKKLVREGVFSAEAVGPKAIKETVQRAREAFERAMNTPKAESTGFKTPARIAGAKGTRGSSISRSRLLGVKAEEKEDLELLEDAKK